MGYGSYVLPDGREAGYMVAAECDQPGCDKQIDRGLGYLCGQSPDGHRDSSEPGCGLYFCAQHEGAHDCTNPACGMWSDDEELNCNLSKSHLEDGSPHRDHDGAEFTTGLNQEGIPA